MTKQETGLGQAYTATATCHHKIESEFPHPLRITTTVIAIDCENAAAKLATMVTDLSSFLSLTHVEIKEAR